MEESKLAKIVDASIEKVRDISIEKPPPPGGIFQNNSNNNININIFIKDVDVDIDNSRKTLFRGAEQQPTPAPLHKGDFLFVVLFAIIVCIFASPAPRQTQQTQQTQQQQGVTRNGY